jgi:hypothetical protein
VTDAEFIDFVNAFECFYGFIAQPPAGFNAEFKLMGQFNGIDNI